MQEENGTVGNLPWRPWSIPLLMKIPQIEANGWNFVAIPPHGAEYRKEASIFTRQLPLAKNI